MCVWMNKRTNIDLPDIVLIWVTIYSPICQNWQPLKKLIDEQQQQKDETRSNNNEAADLGVICDWMKQKRKSAATLCQRDFYVRV